MRDELETACAEHACAVGPAMYNGTVNASGVSFQLAEDDPDLEWLSEFDESELGPLSTGEFLELPPGWRPKYFDGAVAYVERMRPGVVARLAEGEDDAQEVQLTVVGLAYDIAEHECLKKRSPEFYEQEYLPALREAWLRQAVHQNPEVMLPLLKRELARRQRSPQTHGLPRRSLGGRSPRPSRRRTATCKARSPGRRTKADDPEPELGDRARASGCVSVPGGRT